jgi:phytoene dehydrogenase-like protein
MGGTAAVPAALLKLALKLGVEVQTGVSVSKILDDGHSVQGVVTDAGEKIFASAAGFQLARAASAHIANSSRVIPREQFEKRRAYEPACSGGFVSRVEE